MSHVATNWAFQQRGLTAIAFRVLAQLADCHNPSQGCFPSQKYLAERCEIARSSVNRHLLELERLGFVKRIASVDPVTHRQLPTRYILAFEPEFATIDAPSRVPTTDTAPDDSRVPTADTENSPSRVPETGGAVSDSSGTLTCKEPIIPQTPLPSDVFEVLVGKWPVTRHGNLTKAQQAWDGLSPEDKRKAHDEATRAIVGMTRQKRTVPKLQGYLQQRMFEEFAGAPEIDTDGSWIITPQCREWSAWLGWIRKTYGAKAVEDTIKRGTFLPKSRWPEGHIPERA